MSIYDIGILVVICILGGFYLANLLHAFLITYTQWRDDEVICIRTFGMDMFCPDDEDNNVHLGRITDFDSFGTIVLATVFFTFAFGLGITVLALAWPVALPVGILVLIARWDKARHKLVKAARKKDD